MTEVKQTTTVMLDYVNTPDATYDVGRYFHDVSEIEPWVNKSYKKWTSYSITVLRENSQT